MKEIQDHLTLVLLIIFVFTCIIQFSYYLFIYIRFATYHQKPGASNEIQPVTVIVCARNEVNNLRKYILSILEQSHPSFEVIVVNDCSWDESGIYLEELQGKYANLKVVTIK